MLCLNFLEQIEQCSSFHWSPHYQLLLFFNVINTDASSVFFIPGIRFHISYIFITNSSLSMSFDLWMPSNIQALNSSLHKLQKQLMNCEAIYGWSIHYCSFLTLDWKLFPYFLKSSASECVKNIKVQKPFLINFKISKL